MPSCAHCDQQIKRLFVRVNDTPVHEECCEAYVANNIGTCANCQSALLDQHAVVSGGDLDRQTLVHTACIEAFRRSQPDPSDLMLHCVQCGGEIEDACRTVDDAPLHEDCIEAYQIERDGTCDHCHTALSGRIVKVYGHGLETDVRVHARCFTGYREAFEESLNPLRCAQCKEIIEGRYMRCNDGTPLHEQCVEAHSASLIGRCYHCGELLSDDCCAVRGPDIDGEVQMHADCFEEFKRQKDEAPPPVDRCSFCHTDITTSYVKCNEAPLHEECLDEYMAQAIGRCKHCERALRGRYVTLAGGGLDGEIFVHEGCVDAFKAAVAGSPVHSRGTRVVCAQCSAPIEKHYMRVGDTPLHQGCVDSYIAATVGSCVHCDQPLHGKYLTVAGNNIDGHAKVHEACLAQFKQRLSDRSARAKKRRASVPVICGQCDEQIRDAFVKVGDVPLHKQCLDDYVMVNVGSCGQCHRPLEGNYVTLRGGVDGYANVHEACLEEFKRATRPCCSACGQKVMEDKVMVIGDQTFHEHCIRVVHSPANVA